MLACQQRDDLTGLEMGRSDYGSCKNSLETEGIIVEEYITSLAEKLGLPESVAKIATAKLLQYIKAQMGDSFGGWVSMIPGAKELLDSDGGDAEPAGGGGMFGGLAKAAGGLLGGEAGEGLELMGELDSAGVSADKAPGMLQHFTDMVQKQAGDDGIQKLAAQIPALKQYLG